MDREGSRQEDVESSRMRNGSGLEMSVSLRSVRSISFPFSSAIFSAASAVSAVKKEFGCGLAAMRDLR
jgi:hypothetical protein